MNMAIRKTPNASEDGSVPTDNHGHPTTWCEYCGNEGVVLLEGSETIGGVEYSRGSAPCPWCDQGQLRYAEWTAPTSTHKGTDKQGGKHLHHHQRIDAASHFTMYDVQPTAPEPTRRDRFTPNPAWLREREAAGIPRAALQAITPSTAWPPEWRTTGAPSSLVTSLGEPDDAEVERKRQAALEAKNNAERVEARHQGAA